MYNLFSICGGFVLDGCLGIVLIFVVFLWFRVMVLQFMCSMVLGFIYGECYFIVVCVNLGNLGNQFYVVGCQWVGV